MSTPWRARTSYNPVVQYLVQDTTYTFQDQVGSFKHCTIGEHVSVLYNPSDLNDATIDRGRGKWRAPLVPFAIAAFLWVALYTKRQH
jgi:hypothetical protein